MVIEKKKKTLSKEQREFMVIEYEIKKLCSEKILGLKEYMGFSRNIIDECEKNDIMDDIDNMMTLNLLSEIELWEEVYNIFNYIKEVKIPFDVSMKFISIIYKIMYFLEYTENEDFDDFLNRAKTHKKLAKKMQETIFKK